MTKDEYFAQKHKALALQFGIRKTTIEFIRRFALGERKMTRAQIILWIEQRMQKTRGKILCPHCKGTGRIAGKPNPKIEHAQALAFIKKATERDWKDITYPYKFER